MQELWGHRGLQLDFRRSWGARNCASEKAVQEAVSEARISMETLES